MTSASVMRHVVLDLDGTIIDSAPGICVSIAHAYATVGIAPPSPAVLRSWIGPPIREKLAVELAPYGEETVTEAQAAFRAHYDEHGGMGSVVYEGIVSALDALQDMGADLSIATNKPAPLARAAIQEHGLTHYFPFVAAPPDGHTRVPKERLLTDLATRGVRLSAALMVGDRAGDMLAAHHHGMAPIGVLWGYGNAGELHDAGATAIVKSPHELPGHVIALGVGQRPPVADDCGRH